MDVLLFCCIIAGLTLQQGGNVLSASASVSGSSTAPPKEVEEAGKKLDAELQNLAKELEEDAAAVAAKGAETGTAIADSTASAGNGVVHEVQHQVSQTAPGGGNAYAAANAQPSSGTNPQWSYNMQYPPRYHYQVPIAYPNTGATAGYFQGASNGAINYADQAAGRANGWVGYGVDRLGNYVDPRLASYGVRPGFQAAGNGVWQNGEAARQQSFNAIRHTADIPYQVYQQHYYTNPNHQVSPIVGNYRYANPTYGQGYSYSFQYPTNGAQVSAGVQG